MSVLLMAATGEKVEMGRRIQAVAGTHAGSWWRLDDLAHNGREHVVHVSRVIGRTRRRACMPLHVFGLVVSEVKALWHRLLIHGAHKIDDYMWAGIFALVPLAFFERYHGAEYVTEVFRMIFGA